MANILKHSHIILAGLAVAAAGLPIFALAQAPDALVVNFENTPLFDEANFFPGDDVTRFVKVTNNTETARDIAVEAINTSDPDGLGDALILKITEGAVTLYEDTLADFFGAGQFTLSNLAGEGSSTQYDFTVSFQEGAENEYEGKTVNFDILIGVLGEGGGSSSGGGEENGGGGGGSGSTPSGLVIKDELKIIDIGETSATVEWTTSYLATSQVIYAADGEAHVLDLSDNAGTPPVYGYAHTTPEFDVSPKAAAHSVTVTGLTPGTTYFLRAVSHASPPTITREHTFATLALAGIGGEEGVGQQFPGGLAPEQGEGLSREEESGSDTGAGSLPASGSGGEAPEETAAAQDGEGLNAFLAGIGFFDIPLWLAIALALIVLFFFILFRRRKKKQDEVKV